MKIEHNGCYADEFGMIWRVIRHKEGFYANGVVFNEDGIDLGGRYRKLVVELPDDHPLAPAKNAFGGTNRYADTREILERRRAFTPEEIRERLSLPPDE